MLCEFVGKRLTECGIVHAQRSKDILIHIIVKWLVRHALNNISGEGCSPIGIGRGCSRIKDTVRHPLFQIFLKRHQVFRITHDQIFYGFLEPCSMRHQMPHRHGFIAACRNFEIQISVHVGVKVDVALFNLLHDRGPCHEFGHGTRPEQGLVGDDRCAFFDVGIAIAPRRQNFSILYDRNHGTGDITAIERIGHITIKPGIEVVLAELCRSLLMLIRDLTLSLCCRLRGER